MGFNKLNFPISFPLTEREAALGLRVVKDFKIWTGILNQRIFI